MTTPRALRIPFVLGVAAALLLALGLDAHAQNTCNAGKAKCMAKEQLCLLKAEGVALKRGEPVDAAKRQKCIDAFEDEEKGCIAKLEGRQKAEKPKTLCTETGDVAALEASVDTYVDDLLGTIVLDYPAVEPRNLCHPKIALCVGKYAQCVLTALQKGFKTGDPVDSVKLQKCVDKFTNAETGKGCMEKVYAKQNPEKPETLCDVPDDVANLNVKTAAFVTDVIRLVLQTCEDGIQNLDETDVDCGGSCAACANGNSCLAHTDCAEAFCNAGTCHQNLCLLPCPPPGQCFEPGTCNNPITGTCAYPTKANGTSCDDGNPLTGSDICTAGVCAGTPIATCSDGIQNQDETGIDCGGSCPPCPGSDGAPCAAPTDCNSGLCSLAGSCVSTAGCPCWPAWNDGLAAPPLSTHLPSTVPGDAECTHLPHSVSMIYPDGVLHYAAEPDADLCIDVGNLVGQTYIVPISAAQGDACASVLAARGCVF